MYVCVRCGEVQTMPNLGVCEASVTGHLWYLSVGGGRIVETAKQEKVVTVEQPPPIDEAAPAVSLLEEEKD